MRCAELSSPPSESREFWGAFLGSPLDADRAAVDYVATSRCETQPPNPTRSSRRTLCWNPPTLEELVAGLEPLRPDESFDIPDMTDEEWEEFVAALHE